MAQVRGATAHLTRRVVTEAIMPTPDFRPQGQSCADNRLKTFYRRGLAHYDGDATH